MTYLFPKFSKAFILGSALMSLGGCVTINAEQTEAAATSSSLVSYELPHYKRVNLVVADLDRSLTIYQDILGFLPGNISNSPLDSFSYPVFNFPPQARMRYTYLGEPGENRVLGLTEVKNVTLPRPTSSPHMTASVLGVTDLPGKITRLKALGLEVTASKTTGGSEFRFMEQAFTDYDGHLIVLYEILGE